MRDEAQPAFLEDVLVIDLTDERASFCSKVLADLGARVTRIEEGGDSPPSQSDLPSHAYHSLNKECLTVDLKAREGRAILRRLLKTADVLIETRPARLSNRLQFRPKSLARLNPGLIHLFISAFGRTSRMTRYRWDNAVLSAFGGQTYLSGPSSGPPVAPSGDQSYNSASLFGAVAVLLALRERTKTGRGQFVDLSTQEAVVSTLDHVMVDYFFNGSVSKRQGNVYGDRAFVILPCSDGYVQITILQNWDTLVELMSSEGMADDLLGNQWKEEKYRESRFDHVMEVVGNWTRTHSKAELFQLGQAMRFPWAPVCTPDEVAANPQLDARGFFRHVRSSPRGRETSVPGPPYRFRSVSPPPSATVRTNAVDDFSGEAPGGEVLKGIRVLDFTWMLAGPYATRILADAGAEVIKVQSRRTAKGAEDNSTGYFATWNRNKRSITLDLDHSEARQIVLDLATKSDVVVENFSPRVMENWGLSYESLAKAKPSLIMESISAMGQSGPWRDYVAFGPTIHALSGLTHLTSKGLDTPVCLGHAYGDTITGLYGALAILAALRLRDVTGEGRYIDLSGYEAVCSVLGPVLLQRGLEHQPKSGDLGLAGCYRCRGDNRWCVISPSGKSECRALCSAIGRPPGLFPSPPADNGSLVRLRESIGRWTWRRSPAQVVRLLRRAGVPAGVVQNASDLAKDKNLVNRYFFVSLPHPTLGVTISDRTPLFFDRSEPAHWRPAPLLGEANEYVFGEILGMSWAEINSLVEGGVIL